jgi:predicted cupin superfamily sugar epimerase
VDASEIIDTLGLVPHPEGGWYRETWRHGEGPAELPGRAHGTAIYFLLVADERSHWHRIDAPEIWHFYAGAPLELWTAADASAHPQLQLLGLDLDAGERPQIVVPAGWGQAATSRGDYTLTGCTVSPGFDFATFELAPPGWAPGMPSPSEPPGASR